MMTTLTKVGAWIDGRNLRDRGLLFGLSIVVFALLAHQIFLQAPLAEEKRLVNQIAREEAEATRIKAEMQKLSGHAPVDPDADKKALLKKLQDEDALADDAINNLRRDLVAPGQMLAMLDTILARQGGQLHLVSLTKLPLLTLNPVGQSAPGTATATANATTNATGTMAVPANQPAPVVNPDPVYKHGVEIVVQGTYFDLMKYLTELEKMSGQVVWGKLELRTDAYPKSTMSIQLFTLSLDKKWMNL